jgi:hypothetical protein
MAKEKSTPQKSASSSSAAKKSPTKKKTPSKAAAALAGAAAGASPASAPVSCTLAPRPQPSAIELYEEIRRRAYELYCERGGQHGSHEADWHRAETEVRAKYK